MRNWKNHLTFSGAGTAHNLYCNQSMWAERERSICRSPLKPTFVTTALRSALAPRASRSRSAHAPLQSHALNSKTFYSSVFTVGLGLMVERKNGATYNVTKLRKVQQTKLLVMSMPLVSRNSIGIHFTMRCTALSSVCMHVCLSVCLWRWLITIT